MLKSKTVAAKQKKNLVCCFSSKHAYGEDIYCYFGRYFGDTDSRYNNIFNGFFVHCVFKGTYMFILSVIIF